MYGQKHRDTCEGGALKQLLGLRRHEIRGNRAGISSSLGNIFPTSFHDHARHFKMNRRPAKLYGAFRPLGRPLLSAAHREHPLQRRSTATQLMPCRELHFSCERPPLSRNSGSLAGVLCTKAPEPPEATSSATSLLPSLEPAARHASGRTSAKEACRERIGKGGRQRDRQRERERGKQYERQR